MSLCALTKEDRAQLTTPDGTVSFNLEFYITPGSLRELLVKESIPNELTMILKVKKPDYLGESMWDFKYEGRSIQGKILDVNWLAKFQNREIDVRPQDALRAKVRIVAHYSYEGEVIDTDYFILEVLEIIPGDTGTQGRLL